MQPLRTSARMARVAPGQSLLSYMAPQSTSSTATSCRAARQIRHSSTDPHLPSRKSAAVAIVGRQAFPNSALRSKTFSNRSLSGIPSIGNQASYSTGAPIAPEPIIHNVFEEKTGSWQYVVADPSTSTAVIIDPVLDYNAVTRTISTETADSLLLLVTDMGYKVDMILETHAHADHLTAASYLQHRLTQYQGHKPLIGIGKRIVQVQSLFSQKYGVPTQEYEGVFDKLFADDEVFQVGNLTAEAIHLPGHTPDHMGYKIGDNVFVGDSVFHADLGSARADFPGGCAEALFKSGRKLLSLPDHVKVWIGHDYPPDGRDPVPSLTVKHHREQNKHLKDGMTEQEFIEMRKKRDVTLAEPKLLHQSLQMNIRAGRLPPPTEAGNLLLHIPLKVQGLQW